MALKKIELTEAQKKILFPAIAALILLVVLFYVISHAFVQLNSIKRAIQDTKRKASALTQLQGLVAKEKEVLKAFRNVSDKNNVIQEVAGWARKEGIEVAGIEPREESIAETNFKKLTLAINGKGGYLQVMKFLHRIEKADFFLIPSGVRLGGFELEGRGRYSGLSDADTGRRDLKLEVSIFLLEQRQGLRDKMRLTPFILVFLAAAMWNAREAGSAQAERDPMMPVQMSLFRTDAPKVKVEKRTSFQIQGVGRGPRGNYVVIDGQVYAEGDTKKDITVVKIGETKVDILVDGLQESLPIVQKKGRN